MARFNANRVPYQKQDQLLDRFCAVLCALKRKEAMCDFIKDLLNRQERIMLIRRLLAAELLLNGKTYRDIQEQLHIGAATIARIDRWLHFGRGGLKRAITIFKVK